jgi:hypothetical protein
MRRNEGNSDLIFSSIFLLYIFLKFQEIYKFSYFIFKLASRAKQATYVCKTLKSEILRTIIQINYIFVYLKSSNISNNKHLS